MLSRLLSVFRHYAHHRSCLDLGQLGLFDSTGRPSGHIDSIRIVAGRIEVSGWSRCQSVSLVRDMCRSQAYPNIPRPDVTAAHPEMAPDAPVGFFLTVPHGAGPSLLICHDGADHVVNRLPVPRRWRQRSAHLRLVPGFLLRLAAGVPDYVKWTARGDVAARTAYRNRLGLDLPAHSLALDAKLFDPQSLAEAPDGQEITIVLPVFNALGLLREALARILAHTDLPWRLVMVEDCSTDPEVRPFLRNWRAGREAAVADRIMILENQRNLGFVQSVNKALEHAIPLGNHVVLLNSDALVPAKWASRLLRPVLTHDAVASVTPMSNDAEILSAPGPCQRTVLAPGAADLIDRTAAGLNPDACLAALPTGVGFCLLMNIDYLRRVPALDTVFGRGYGEEVDWCQKIRKLGGRNIGHAGLFVEHRGGTSFGSAEKLKLIQDHNAIISDRYPGYDAEVQDFIRHDPLATPRLALTVAWANAQARGPVPIYVAHSLGGGAEEYLKHRLRQDIEATGAAIVLRVGADLRWRMECHSSHGVISGATGDFALVKTLLAPIASRRVVYSCAVGDADPVTLPGHIVDLVGEGDRLEVLVHDYFMVSPSYCLLNADGAFTAVPPPDSKDRAHRTARPDGEIVTLARWRAEWGRLLSAATRVTVFSNDSRTHLLAAYPACAERVDIVPHSLPHPVPRVEPVASQPPVIGVLGNIGPAKGAEVLRRLSRALDGSGRAKLVLIGNVAPGYALAPSTIVHGTYAPREIAGLARRYRICAWFIPSIWPETFSFTTHEALATGLPVAVFDLGAQAEAVRKSDRGRLVPLGLAQGDPLRMVAKILDTSA